MTKTTMLLSAAGLFILGALVAIGGEHLLFKQKDPRDNMATIASLQDWRLSCPPRTTKTGTCILQQFIAQKGTNSVVAELTVAQKGKSDMLTVVVPLGVFIPPGLKFTVGKGEPKSIAFKTCLQTDVPILGCIATAPIDAGLAAAMSQNSGGQITVVTGEGKTVPLNFSLHGYREALAARAVDIAARQ